MARALFAISPFVAFFFNRFDQPSWEAPSFTSSLKNIVADFKELLHEDCLHSPISNRPTDGPLIECIVLEKSCVAFLNPTLFVERGRQQSKPRIQRLCLPRSAE